MKDMKDIQSSVIKDSQSSILKDSQCTSNIAKK